MFLRNCPLCKKEIKYKSEKTRDNSEINQYNCFSCLRSGKNNPNYGKISANRGKKRSDFMSPEGLIKANEHLSKGIYSGFKHSEETKIKIGLTSKGENNPFFGKIHSEETKNYIRLKTLEQHKNGNLKLINTSIEIKISQLLNDLNLKYRQQEIFGYWIFDFYLIEFDVYIECDGDYWHGHPDFFPKEKWNGTQIRNSKNAKAKDTYTNNKNKLLIRIWEFDINNNIEEVKQRIKILLNI